MDIHFSLGHYTWRIIQALPELSRDDEVLTKFDKPCMYVLLKGRVDRVLCLAMELTQF